MKKFGIDISTWQAGYPYYRAKQEGVEFAIIRAGFWDTKDSQYENHYAALRAIGMPMGAYWYSYAQTVDEAKMEAKAFLEIVKGHEFEYPLYLDLEDPSQRGLGRSTLDAIVRAFGDIIEGAGYYFGVYTNVDWYRNVVSGAELNAKYDWWIASWGTERPSGINAGIWQFGGSVNSLKSAKIAGVTTDQNYAYIDYPKIIREKGLNGFKKNSTAPTPAPVTTPVVPQVKLSAPLIKKGDTVQVKNAVQYNGQPFTAYFSTYDVLEVSGDRVVIGKSGVVTAAVNAESLVKVGSVPVAPSAPKIVPGGKVKVLQAIQYTGQPFDLWYSVYDVIDVTGARVVIGIGDVVTAAVNISNLRAV